MVSPVSQAPQAGLEAEPPNPALESFLRCRIFMLTERDKNFSPSALLECT